MGDAEILIAGLLVAVAGLGALAQRIGVPYPIVLVVGGALFGLVPGVPAVALDPEVVLVVFLPPLLYSAAIWANAGDLRTAWRGLALNATCLVLVTMCTVAVTAHMVIPDMPWSAAFVLGAIVSPTDPLAAATVMRRAGAPRQLVSGIEGEGLFNDATALVAYRVAVAAVVAGGFSLADAALTFILGAVAGVAIGLAVGWAAGEIRRRTPDPQINITISLLTGYAAFVPADVLGASGVLAAVTAGLYMGVRGPAILGEPETRLQGFYLWDILEFVVNATLFVLIGLQLRAIVEALDGEEPLRLVAYGLLVAGVVTVTRLAWLFSVPYLVRALDRRPAQRALRTGAGWRLVAAWAGMRGAVSLAVALALPLTTDDDTAFPQRDLIIFLTFVVILITLVVQGLTLPAIMRRVPLHGPAEDANEELRARFVAARAALTELDVLADEDWARPDTVERLRRFYEFRVHRLAAQAGKIDDQGAHEDQSRAYQRTLRQVLAAQRRALLALRSDGRVSNEVMNRVLRELDLEESRLEF